MSGALVRSWTCDDAYISFRYARNLVEGNGLVFNPGERVEGYTNFAWTLWCGLGLRLGFSAESWSQFWSVICYLTTVGLLMAHRVLGTGKGEQVTALIPVAALLAAVHPDLHIWATGGLETSAVTALVVAGYLLCVHTDLERVLPLFLTGAVFGLAVLTRPDALLFAALGGFYVLATSKRKLLGIASFGLGFAFLYVPATAWRISYYGDFFPNTFYAKSAGAAWWDQGWFYVGLYLRRYWVLFLGLPWLLFQLGKRRRAVGSTAPDLRPDLLAMGFVLAYVLYVARIGGGFMYARMLIPATPFLLILFEEAVLAACKRRTAPILSVTAVAMLLVAFLPSPIEPGESSRGVVDEWDYYHHPEAQRQYETDPVLRRFLSDLPVTIPFIGSQARTIYEARIPVAIEAQAGLTDRFIAHQKIAQRGRVGHEKLAPASYLITERKSNLAIGPDALGELGLADAIPHWPIDLDGVHCWVLHWDPQLMNELRVRGARFEDFPTALDATIRRLGELRRDEVEILYRQAKLFYFDHVRDPERQLAFERRLS